MTPGGLRHRVGHRGAALLFFGLLDLVYGSVLITSTPPPGSTLGYIGANWPPLPAWGWVWIGVGLVCTVHAFLRRDTWGFVAAMAIKFAWASAYVGALLDGANVWALAGASIWVMAIGLVANVATWPEPIRLEDDGGRVDS